jgi:hypothetical protein
MGGDAMTKLRFLTVLAAALLLAWGMSCQSPSSSNNPSGGSLGNSASTTNPSTGNPGSNSDSGTTPGVGTLRLTITDGPVDNVAKILVTMTEIRVHQSSGPEDSSFVTVSTGPLPLDILELKTKPIVFEPDLPAGEYNQIRISLSKNQGQIYFKGDSTPYPLSVPSDEIKIHLQFDVLSGAMTQILLDFDAEQSLHVVQKGKKQEYILRPVINPVSQQTPVVNPTSR